MDSRAACSRYSVAFAWVFCLLLRVDLCTPLEASRHACTWLPDFGTSGQYSVETLLLPPSPPPPPPPVARSPGDNPQTMSLASRIHRLLPAYRLASALRPWLRPARACYYQCAQELHRRQRLIAGAAVALRRSGCSPWEPRPLICTCTCGAFTVHTLGQCVVALLGVAQRTVHAAHCRVSTVFKIRRWLPP